MILPPSMLPSLVLEDMEDFHVTTGAYVKIPSKFML
jgi:hypothetical protein